MESRDYEGWAPRSGRPPLPPPDLELTIELDYTLNGRRHTQRTTSAVPNKAMVQKATVLIGGQEIAVIPFVLNIEARRLNPIMQIRRPWSYRRWQQRYYEVTRDW